METPAANASLPHQIPSGRHNLIKNFTAAVAVGCIIGPMVAAFLLWGPYNRVVIHKQPVAQTIQVDLVHLSKGGFVAAYLNDSGSRLIGVSPYLSAGSYRKILIPYDYQLVLPDWTLPESEIKESHVMFARLFLDDGDRMFEEFSDTPVRTVFGKLYERDFAMTYDRRNMPLTVFRENPVQYILDAVIP